MKTILTVLFATVLVALSQAPPIQRNSFTTNLEPAALDVVNGATGDRSVNLDLPEWRFRLNQGSNLTMLAFGDSTGLYTVSYLREPIFNRLGSNGFAAGQMANIHAAGAYTNLGTASSTNWLGVFYVLGTNSSDGPGQITVTNWGTANGGGIWSSVFQAAVERSPSSGTLMWQTRTNGGAWVNQYIFNASGTYGAITNRLVLPLGWYNSRLIYSNGGPTKVLMSEQYDGTLTGRGARFYDFTYAGSRIGQVTNIATNILGPVLAMLNPAVIWLEHRDSSNEYVEALSPLKSLIDNWIPRADVVIIGVGPKQTDDHDLVGQNSVAREFCRTNRWAYLDMRALKGYTSYFGVTNTYGVSDGGGVHYPDAAWRAQSGSAFHRLPIMHNEAANGAFNMGAPYLSPPEGSRHFDARKGTNYVYGNLGLNGILSMQNYLDVNSFIITRGGSAGVVLQDRLDSTDSARNWTLFNSDYTLEFYHNTYLFEMSGKFGIYRFSPYSTGSPYSRLGDSTHWWNHIYANGIQSTNSTNANLFINMGKAGIGTNDVTATALMSVPGKILSGSGSFTDPSIAIGSTNTGFSAPGNRIDGQIAGAQILTLGTGAGAGNNLHLLGGNGAIGFGYSGSGIWASLGVVGQMPTSGGSFTTSIVGQTNRVFSRIGSATLGPVLQTTNTQFVEMGGDDLLGNHFLRSASIGTNQRPLFLGVGTNGITVSTNGNASIPLGITFPTNVHSAVTLATNGASGAINAGGALQIQVSNAGDVTTSNKVTISKAGVGIGGVPVADLNLFGANRSNGLVRIDNVINATPSAPSTVVAWIPVTLNGTNGFIPFYQ